MSFYIEDPAWASNLQRNLAEYMDTMQNSVYEETDVETESGQPYCGCDDCFWREVLSYAVTRIITGYNEGKISLKGPVVEDDE